MFGTPPILEILKSVTLSILVAKQFTSNHEEPRYDPAKPTFDYIIVGGGTAGCILANRLSEDPKVTVAVIETGYLQPRESMKPGYFTHVPGSDNDYNFKTEKDFYSAQKLQGNSVNIPAGKMLSGTSGMHHMYHTRSSPRDLFSWVQASKDLSWSYNNIVNYYMKSERLEDKLILLSPDSDSYGTNGPIGLNRQSAIANWKIINAFKEIGYEYKLDFNGNKTLGITEPLFQISNGIRQSTAETYLRKTKGRKNVFVFILNTATKILFDDNKRAIGVQVFNCGNNNLTFYAKREVLLAAGVMKTAQLLLLSGIGPKEDLESWGINVLSDLPVGQALRHQVGSVIAFKLNQFHPNQEFNPEEFPIPVTIGLKSLYSRFDYPQYKVVNMLFSPNSTILPKFCSHDLKFVKPVCKRYIEANKEHDLLLSSIYHLYPLSTGLVKLRNTNPFSDPWIHLGMFQNDDDLGKLTQYLKEFSFIERSKSFRELRAEMVDLDLGYCNKLRKGSWPYWKCYAKTMSVTMRQPVASAPLGAVLDPQLRVVGVQGLRVVDAAAIPTPGCGGRIADVMALAERAADLVKGSWDQYWLTSIFRH